MKTTLILFFLATLILSSCNNSTQKIEHSSVDTLQYLQVQDSIHEAIDKQISNDMLADSSKAANAPVKVIRARIVQEEYSSYKNISLTYKNVSDKDITAIKFHWYGENAFGEPADMGNSFDKGWGGGFMDAGLKANKTTSNTWSILSRDAKKVITAFPIEIVFKDGTKWEIEK